MLGMSLNDLIEKAVTKCNIEECKKATARRLPDAITAKHTLLMKKAAELKVKAEELQVQERRMAAEMELIWCEIKELFPELANDQRLGISDDSATVYAAQCAECMSKNVRDTLVKMGAPEEILNIFDRMQGLENNDGQNEPNEE